MCDPESCSEGIADDASRLREKKKGEAAASSERKGGGGRIVCRGRHLYLSGI
jgi:hypothetical protein